MLEGIQLETFLRALEAAKCVLFVGAGFSRDARNRFSQSLPGSAELSATISQWLYGADAEQVDLSLVFQAALRSGRPLDQLKLLLEEHLLCVDMDQWYEAIPRVFWYRIYGTNADDVIERAYRAAHSQLEVVSAPRDEYRDRDQFLRRTQYIKLHGSIAGGDPRTLTFGTLQYAARANSQDEWWKHFVQDYAFQPTIFVGTEIDEPLFWQAISAREARGNNPEERPQSYLVVPQISRVKAELLETFNIKHIAATGARFFDWLSGRYSFPDRAHVLSTVNPDDASVIASGTNIQLQEVLTTFLTSFAPVPRPHIVTGQPKGFLRGSSPSWQDIAAELDAPREVNSVLYGQIEEGLSQEREFAVIALLGEGGAGKTTIMRRVAMSIRATERDVFFSEGAERPDIRAVCGAIASFPRKTCIFIDNASLLGAELGTLLARLKELDRPPVVVFASRFIPFEHKLKEQLPEHRIVEMEVPCLSDQDIAAVLEVLEKHNQLGHLLPLNSEERRYEFKQRAKKQILVALREATEGRDFDEIIRSEFEEVVEFEHRILLLCAALGSAELIDLTERQWFGCAEIPPADALRILRRDLRGLVTIYGTDRLVSARHPVIAEIIVDGMASRGDMLEAYRRCLLTLSREIYPGLGRKTRAWRLFTRLIHHENIYRRFSEDIDRARAVFELTASAFSNDGHFWLQYANLEIDFGAPEFARMHLANAESLLGSTPLVMNTRAHMMLREALTARNFEQALKLRRDAEDILLPEMERAADDDEYPQHIYLTHVLNWIRSWRSDKEAKKKDLEELLEIAKSASARRPKSHRLAGARDAIMREYLSLTVRAQDPGNDRKV